MPKTSTLYDPLPSLVNAIGRTTAPPSTSVAEETKATFIVGGDTFTAVQTAGPDQAVVDGVSVFMNGSMVTVSGEGLSLGVNGLVIDGDRVTTTLALQSEDPINSTSTSVGSTSSLIMTGSSGSATAGNPARLTNGVERISLEERVAISSMTGIVAIALLVGW